MQHHHPQPEWNGHGGDEEGQGFIKQSESFRELLGLDSPSTAVTSVVETTRRKPRANIAALRS